MIFLDVADAMTLVKQLIDGEKLSTTDADAAAKVFDLIATERRILRQALGLESMDDADEVHSDSPS